MTGIRRGLSTSAFRRSAPFWRHPQQYVQRCRPAAAAAAAVQAAHFTTTPYLLDTINKVGLGGNNWSRIEPGVYEGVVKKALESGITMLEAGQEGGDQALLDAFLLEKDKISGEKPITMTLRIGYRTILPPSTKEGEKENVEEPERFQDDVHVEQHPFLGPNRTDAPLDDENMILKPPSADSGGDGNKVIQIMHNISGSYIQRELESSPLIKEYQKDPSTFRIVPLLHNPEAQIMAMESDDITKVPIEERQEFLKQRLADAFFALEQAADEGKISSYGVASNGLILPSEHPLHLSTGALLGAAKIAVERAKKEPWYKPSESCHLSIIQLPVNLMERTGFDVAKELKQKIDDNENYQYLRQNLEIYAMRPLTCYPDRGTGTGHPFKLVDYKLPSGPSQQMEQNGTDKEEVTDEQFTSKQWTHEMEGPPLIYPMALKKAMAHFDAEKILQAKMERELTSEERETLDGCKLLQSMLHDLDADLSKVRSLGAYEQDLYQRIIPLIHDTFEGYDEETADVLQTFFTAYSLAVRYNIAQNTRNLLEKGGDDGKGHKYKEIPDEQKLQDYALEYLLKDPAISRVIIGASKQEHVVEMANLCSKIDKEKPEAGKESVVETQEKNEK